jgi:quercetin dioxygenase-like cupin family protein
MRRRLTVSAGMKTWLALVTSLVVAAFTPACASMQPGASNTMSQSQNISRAGSQAKADGPNEFFTGRVRIEPLSSADGDINVSTAYVTFEPGARSAWHTHPRGQRLIVTAGVGLTQQWGKPVQEIHPGDVVSCPPGVKHWHGASATAAMTHVAVTGSDEHGKNVTWMEKVSDEQYAAGATSGAASRAHETTTEPLSAKQQVIPRIAAFAAMGDLPRLNASLNEGLDAGLSISESKEILVQLYAYSGFPRSLNALGELLKVVESRKQRGIADAPGAEPSHATPMGDALLAKGTANQTQLVGAPVEGHLFDFAPVINQFLRTHLFGDIFERDNLDWQSRELATVGALAAIPGVEPQLRAHMGISLRVGLSAEQLREVAQLLSTHVDAAAGTRANDALAQTQAAKPESK